MSSVANLFDAAMCFAVALLIALTVRGALDPARRSAKEARAQAVPDQATSLPRFQVSTGVLEGEGERLGVAYRLSSGEVVYVPESAAEQAVR